MRRRLFRGLARCGVTVACCGGIAMQAQTPAAPESLVHDETRFFDEAQRSDLSRRLREAQDKLGLRILVAALTYSRDAKAHDAALRLASAWSDDRPALVLVHDRGKAQSAIGASREFWDRYPVDEVVALCDGTTALLQRPDVPPEQSMTEAVDAALLRLSKMESARAKRAQLFTRQDLRLSVAMGAGLVLLLPMALLLLRWSRRRESARSHRHYFPEVEVAARLGAPFGGGTVGEARVRE